MDRHLGWIFLDIDGTLTDKSHQIPKKVVDYLHSLEEEGWKIVFVTGRAFSFADQVMNVITFPHFLAVQNGADILSMPERTVIARRYLNADIIPILEEAYESEVEDFLVYSGYESGDFCYYRPQKFSSEVHMHLEKMKKLCNEPWEAVDNFSFATDMQFPLIKCLGNKREIQVMNEKLQRIPSIAATMIQDPLSEKTYLILVTSKEATKGKVIEIIQNYTGLKGKVIAAGDDLNDVSMLKASEVKIVMETAPQQMHSLATILAKPSTECGIIEALKMAIKK